MNPRAEIPVLAEVDAVLKTPRLLLRPYAESDCDALFALASDPELPRFMTWSPHRDRDETLAFLRRMIAGRAQGTDVAWAIEHEGALTGAIGLHWITWGVGPWRVDSAELGYWLSAALRGRGLISEAVRAALGWAFGTLGLHRVTVRCLEENAASRRVIEKAGFRFLARVPEDLWRDGRWWPSLTYELTAPEWPAR